MHDACLGETKENVRQQLDNRKHPQNVTLDEVSVSLWNDREEHCCPQLRFGQHFSSWSFHRETETPSAGSILPLLPAQACIIHILPIGKVSTEKELPSVIISPACRQSSIV